MDTFRLSFEFFPTKTEEGTRKLYEVRDQLAVLEPDFFSVTYGAGGSTRDRTLDVVSELNRRGISTAPHLSCVGDTKANIRDLLQTYSQNGIDRIVALRGDLPSGMAASTGEMRYANELVSFIRSEFGEQFHLEVAAYPEMHPQAKSYEADLLNFKRKVDAGANSAITQYFFNIDSYFYFVDRCEAMGIDIPIVPGIMPITNYSKLARFSDACGAEIPRWIRKQLEAYGDDQESIQKFGEEVITYMCEDLIENDVEGLHFYTLNQADACLAICKNLFPLIQASSMNLYFFAARKVQRNYFQQLCDLMPDTQVLWHKSFLLPAFFAEPSQPQQLSAIIDNLLREKQNREKNKNKSALYWRFFRAVKTLDAKLLYKRYYQGFSALNGKIVFWNGLKYNQRIAELAARDAGLQCLYMENGLIPGMTTLDVRGINYFNSMPRHAAGYPATAVTSALQLPAMEKPAHLPDEYYFVPLQVNTDSQVTLFSPWIANMRDLLGRLEQLNATLQNKMGKTSPVFVIKRHPAAEDKHLDILQKWAGHTHLIFADDCATPALIQHAKAVITINSTVGIESIIAAKAVIVLGQAFYNIPALTLSANNATELENAVMQIEQGWQPDADLRNRFLVHLEQVYQVQGDWRANDNSQHVQHMVQRLEALR